MNNQKFLCWFDEFETIENAVLVEADNSDPSIRGVAYKFASKNLKNTNHINLFSWISELKTQELIALNLDEYRELDIGEFDVRVAVTEDGLTSTGESYICTIRVSIDNTILLRSLDSKIVEINHKKQ